MSPRKRLSPLLMALALFATPDVKELYDAAQAYDPGASRVPDCALASPKLAFRTQSLEAIGKPRNNPQLSC